MIPAHNEEALLPRLLATVDRARASFRGGRDSIEVIVADDASSDRTAEIARNAGARVISTNKRCIGAVRNAGAAAARGELLAFIDADNQVHPDTFNVIADFLARPDVVGGATGVKPERWSVGIALTYMLFVPVAALLRLDTGVVFCRRRDFEIIGGYDESRRFAEDVVFHLELRRLGRRTGRRLVRASAAKAIFSTRKFDQYGDWHYLPLMATAPISYLNRWAGNKLADWYWYGNRR